MNADGSGTWTRKDPSESTTRVLYKSGPLDSECHLRVTYCGLTGEQLESNTVFPMPYEVKHKPLPEPCPRPIKTVFHFRATNARVPAKAQHCVENVDEVPIQSHH